ncbi:low molecular weight protein-tyrosine-phosphatase [Halomonas sp. YLGW01]|uniref:low molecular weight protein-tyrosine-phosphatase n=1 Tax=Halomonas sp. YLGW01 TaxID=2773308 RepID=UPI0017843D2A|nr:low molecular weight protein-tyrosine-phosphatase [Halomonas sp. YLGW01]
MFEKIMVVCIGNICRSPVAEAMLTQRLPGKVITSAGLGALVGRGVEPIARKLAEADGLDVGEHVARQVSRELLRQVDLVLVMSDGQRHAIGEMSPAALGKTMLLGHWLERDIKEIPDPYRKSEEVFEFVHRRLVLAADTWAKKL